MDETRLKRLRFRAWRRGFREADLILGPFADRHASSLSEAQVTAFEALLEQRGTKSINARDVGLWTIEVCNQA